jgi:hypothetical protein
LDLGLRWLHADGAPEEKCGKRANCGSHDNLFQLLIHARRTIDGSGWFDPRHRITPGLSSNVQSHQIWCFRLCSPLDSVGFVSKLDRPHTELLDYLRLDRRICQNATLSRLFSQ